MTAEESIPKRGPADLNLSAQILYKFITSDFESTWTALAAQRAEGAFTGRGNMMFARQAMTLLEFACRLYGQNADVRAEFSRALFEIETRYFTTMPGACAVAEGGVLLPFDPRAGPESSDRTLLTALFDVVRHGLAHYYQGITVELTDGRVLAISMSGASYGDELGKNLRRELYLGFVLAEHDDVVIRLYPDVLYLDVKEAIRRTGLLDRGLTLEYFERGGEGGRTYQFGGAALRRALEGGRHERVIARPGLQNA